MIDEVYLDVDQSVQASSGVWYRNIQRLGAGGTASTFLVLATSGPMSGIPFALKVFRRLSMPERRDSFLQEVQFLKTCSHPSIMRVFDDGVFYKRFPFVVAEYLPQTLFQVLRTDTSSMVARLSYILQLLSGLAYLASQPKPVIHRDIKPQNVFLKGHSCVLGDFGLLKYIEDPADDRDTLKSSIGAGMPWSYRTPDLVDYLKNVKLPTCKSDVFQLVVPA